MATGILNRISRENRKRILRFCAVGVSGVGVNLLVTLAVRELWFVESGALSVLNAAAIAGTLVSIFTNFLLNDFWTWGDRSKSPERGWIKRLVKYYLTASLGASLELGAFNLVLHFTNPEFYLWAKLVGIGFATFSNFTMMHFWVFRNANPTVEG